MQNTKTMHSGWRLAALPIAGVLAVSLLATTAIGVAAQSEECAPADGPVTLEYWTWGAGYADAAALWNEQNPDIQVEFSDIAVGNDGGYQKMRDAIRAGTAPDVVFLEFDTVPSFRSQDALVDVSACLPPEAIADFVQPVQDLESLGEPGAAYGLGIGGGPMALFYRADLFEEHGIEVPVTWQEFAEAAAKVREVAPDAYLGNFSANSPNWFAGLAAQGGAQWFGIDGSSWKVAVNDEASTQVAELWQGMIDRDEVSTINDFTPEWSSALGSDTIWSWPSAVWGAGVIKGSLPDQEGKWAVAPLPTWGEGMPGSTSWGGGGLNVLKSSEHPNEAAQFAYWMGSDPEAMRILNAAIGIYPTTNTLLADPLFSEPDAFFGDEVIFDVFLDASENLAPVTWGPSMTDTYLAVNDAFNAALSAADNDLVGALEEAQKAIVGKLQQQGFGVIE